jgi:hypothetical protein
LGYLSLFHLSLLLENLFNLACSANRCRKHGRVLRHQGDGDDATHHRQTDGPPAELLEATIAVGLGQSGQDALHSDTGHLVVEAVTEDPVEALDGRPVPLPQEAGHVAVQDYLTRVGLAQSAARAVWVGHLDGDGGLEALVEVPLDDVEGRLARVVELGHARRQETFTQWLPGAGVVLELALATALVLRTAGAVPLGRDQSDVLPAVLARHLFQHADVLLASGLESFPGHVVEVQNAADVPALTVDCIDPGADLVQNLVVAQAAVIEAWSVDEMDLDALMVEDELLDVLRNLGLALDVLHLNNAF